MKKYLVAILCGLIFTVAIGWAAETLDRYKDQLAQSKKNTILRVEGCRPGRSC